MRLFQSGFAAVLLPALLASASPQLSPRAAQPLGDTVDLTLLSGTNKPFPPVSLTRVNNSPTMFRVEEGWYGVPAFAKSNEDGSEMAASELNFLTKIGSALAHGYADEDRERWWLIVKDASGGN